MIKTIFEVSCKSYKDIINDNTAIHFVLETELYDPPDEKTQVFNLNIKTISWANNSFKTVIHLHNIQKNDIDYLIKGLIEIKEKIQLEETKSAKRIQLLAEADRLKNELN